MIQADPPYKVSLEEEELEYLVNKKNEDTAALIKTLKFLTVMIVGITVLVGIGMFAVVKVSPDVFISHNQPNPDILATSFELMLLLLGVVAIATYYSYSKTLKKVIKDIREGKKTIEPCMVIRKLHSNENNTYNVYITSVIRLSVPVTEDEYAMLHEGDKISLEYSPYSKIFFGYFI